MTIDSMAGSLTGSIDPNATPNQLLASLRNIRNSVIGSRTRKSNLASKGLLPYFSALLLYPIPSRSLYGSTEEGKGKGRECWSLEDSLEIRGLAATILGSVAHGATPPTLLALLRSRVPSALLRSLTELSNLPGQASQDHSAASTSAISASVSPLIACPSYLKLLESLLRAQRSLLLSLADEISPSSRWGIGTGWGSGTGTTVNLMSRNGNFTSSHTSSTSSNLSSSYMLSGRSTREKSGWEVADSNGRIGDCDCDFTEQSSKGRYAWSVSEDHPRLTSSLPDRSISASLDHPLDPHSELVHNSRITMTKIFSLRFVPLLLGALFIVEIPLGDSQKAQISFQDPNSNGIGLSRPITPVGGESGAAREHGRSSSSTRTRTTTSEQSKQGSGSFSRSSSRMSVDGESSDRIPSEEKLEISDLTESISLPLTTRSKILSITELVCAIISRCVGVAGIGPFNIKGIKDEVEEAEAKFKRVESPAHELQIRRERILTFRSRDSPWKRRRGEESSYEESYRGRSPRRAPARLDVKDKGQDLQMTNTTSGPHPHLQGTLLRSSRSTSRSQSRPNAKTQDVEMAVTTQSSLTKVEEMREGIEENQAIIAENKGVLDVLLSAIECGFGKTQEAALWALSELIKENPDSGIRLFRLQTTGGLLPTSMLLNFRKEHSAPLRLAAFCCLTHIIKLHSFTPRTNHFVLHALIELLDHAGDVQVQATFAIARLVADDSELQQIACESYDAIKKLAGLLEKSSAVTTPGYGIGSNGGNHFGGRIGGPIDEGLIRLREGALSCLAALTDTREDLIHLLIDYNKPSMLPLIIPSLTASSLGIRISSAKLIKCLSRSVRILRTSLIDSGVADKLLQMLKNRSEHPQVKLHAMDALSNLVLKFSPMKQYLLEHGAVEQLTQIAKGQLDGEGDDYLTGAGLLPAKSQKMSSEGEAVKVRAVDGNARFVSLWVLKNLLHGTDVNLKRQVMEHLGWEHLSSLAFPSLDSSSVELTGGIEGQGGFDNYDVQTREQALEIIGNLCSATEEDVEFTLMHLGKDRLVEALESIIWQEVDASVLMAVASILINVAAGNDEHRRLILDRPNLVDAILYFMKHPQPRIRASGCWVALNLTYQGPNSSSSSKINPASSFSTWAGSPSPPPPAPALPGSLPSSRDPTTADNPSTAAASVQELALERFKAFGFRAQVRELTFDEELEVRDRAKALNQFFV